MLAPPLNIPEWLSQNTHLLQPPINNHCIHAAGPNHDMTIMIVGGPNARTDYHINPTPELFYQYRGSMVLRVIDSSASASASASPSAAAAATSAATSTSVLKPGSEPEPEAHFRTIPIREGELFLLPGNTPHNPIRFADTVGLVVELSRPEGVSDRLRWYCQDCRCVVFETDVGDLGPGLKGAVKAFAEDEQRRTCRACGALCETVPKGVVRP